MGVVSVVLVINWNQKQPLEIRDLQPYRYLMLYHRPRPEVDVSVKSRSRRRRDRGDFPTCFASAV